MELCIEDYANSQVIRDLIRHRLMQENDAGRAELGISMYQDSDGVFFKFLIGKGVFLSVKVYSDVDGAMGDCHLVLMEGHYAPAAYITLSGSFVWYGGRSEEEYPAMIAEIQARLLEGFVPPKLHMPYGFVEDGLVTAFCFAQESKGEVEGSLHATMADFALQGHELPAPFLMRPVDPVAYVETFWEFMFAGKIVELRDRIVSHPDSLWFYSSSVEWPHLVFSGADDQLPLLPAGMPYFRRLASEPSGGDMSRTRLLVQQHLEAGEPPVNMSQWFKQK